MKIDGNKLVTILFENSKGKTYIENYPLNCIVNNILQKAYKDLQYNEEYIDKKTQYIVIDNKMYSPKADIKLELEICLLNVPIVCKGYFTHKYNAYVETQIKDFYNEIIKIGDEYACDLDTDINNIKIKVKELETLNNYKLEGAN